MARSMNTALKIAQIVNLKMKEMCKGGGRGIHPGVVDRLTSSEVKQLLITATNLKSKIEIGEKIKEEFRISHINVDPKLLFANCSKFTAEIFTLLLRTLRSAHIVPRPIYHSCVRALGRLSDLVNKNLAAEIFNELRRLLVQQHESKPDQSFLRCFPGKLPPIPDVLLAVSAMDAALSLLASPAGTCLNVETGWIVGVMSSIILNSLPYLSTEPGEKKPSVLLCVEKMLNSKSVTAACLDSTASIGTLVQCLFAISTCASPEVTRMILNLIERILLKYPQLKAMLEEDGMFLEYRFDAVLSSYWFLTSLTSHCDPEVRSTVVASLKENNKF
eukprot:GHVL01000225.1.p1 GENE.GHVL01000225.1~~GHVL01000225.1.p1  ORF type:complete len:331 (+),score=49.02 GHVL01000225.1:141-1133(+)